MNITEIQICSPGQLAYTLDTHVKFSLNSQDRSSPFILKSATGLEPSEIIKTYNDGPKFFRVRPKERVVAFSIKLNPNYTGNVTIGDLRDQVYKLVAYNTKANVWNSDTRLQIRFMNGTTYVASLFGYITRVDADIFSNSSDVSITIECEDPFLRSTTEIDLSSGIQPTSTVSHTYFNGITYEVESAFACTDNKSTAPHGFKMEAECIAVPPSSETEPEKFIVWDSRNPLYYIFSSMDNFQVGDVIHFSSEEDDRYLYNQRTTIGGTSYRQMINRIYWGSIWPMISPGENFIEVSQGFKITKVSHRESYWGI